jgi:putative ABC transport system permease protein
MVYVALTILIGISSGIYTSGYLSKLKVVGILKSTSYAGNKKSIIRSILIVIELIVFCSFVSSTFIIRSQYIFAISKDPGYYNKDIIMVNLGRDFKGYSAFINNLTSNPNIISAAGVMDGLPMQGSMTFMLPNFQNKQLQVKIEGLAVDYNYLKTMGVRFVEGRDFSRDFASDMTESIILNQTAIKSLGITDPKTEKIGNKNIIGIVRDFNLHSLHSEIPPVAIDMTDTFIDQVAIHFKPGTLKSILPFLEAEWKKAAPDRPFIYLTIEDIIKDLYSSEKNLTAIISIFALFTIVIAAFGLFGLTLFIGRTRTKEIGLKKVFGSSEKKIVLSFLFENFLLTAIAVLISVPVTYYFMSQWLTNFVYKVS